MKPSKPSRDFPLFPHGNGQWAKKIKGKLHYFGPWNDPQAALAKFQATGDLQDTPKFTEPKAERKRPVFRKPHPDFPLFPHQGTGRWAKKVRGNTHYFGKVEDDPDGKKALDLWLAQKDDLLAGRKAQPDHGGLTVKETINRFLNDKLQLLNSNEIGQRTFDEYKATGEFVAEHFSLTRAVSGLTPDDFQELRAKMAKRWGPVRLGNEIQRVRSIFRHVDELLDRPVHFGKAFKKPSAKVMRLNRAARGERDFTAEQLRDILAIANPNMKAMTLLAINGGFGNTDLGKLPTKVVNLDEARIYWPRTKTGIPRNVPLWPETVEAVKAVLKQDRLAVKKEHEGLLFISPRGKSYVVQNRTYGLTAEFARALKQAGIKGHSFYDLRHTFQTVAEEARDIPAVKAIMGHSSHSNDMAAVYRQRITKERLLAVTDYLRDWLFGQTNSIRSAG